MNPARVPSWDELLRDPQLVERLPAPVIRDLYFQGQRRQSAMAGVLEVLALRILESGGNGREESAPERWLTPEEAAGMLNVTTRWLYRHKEKLPHRKFSPKCLRFSEAGLRKWSARRMG